MSKTKLPANLKEYCESATLEKSVEKGIRDMAAYNGWRTHKIDVMKGVTVDYAELGGGKRKFTEGTPGQADLIMVRPRLATHAHMKAFPVALPMDCFYVELKRPKGGRYEAHQKIWADVTEKDGFVVLRKIRSWDELVAEARKRGIEVERHVR